MHYLIKPKVYSSACYEYEYTGSDHDFYMSLLDTLVTSNKFDTQNIIIGKLVANPQMMFGEVRCIADNIEYITALTLDYDKQLSMDEFHELFHEYRYYMYTTWSHFKQKREGGSDRFRVIVPLDKPLYAKFIGLPWLKQPLIDHFRVDDVSCFDRGHWQILPCASSRDEYISKYNAGKDFSLSILRDICTPLKHAYDAECLARANAPKPKPEPDYDRDAHIDRYIAKCIDPIMSTINLSNRGKGCGTNRAIGRVFGMMMAHEKIQFTSWEVESILCQYTSDRQSIKDIRGWEQFFHKKN